MRDEENIDRGLVTRRLRSLGSAFSHLRERHQNWSHGASHDRSTRRVSTKPDCRDMVGTRTELEGHSALVDLTGG